MSLGSKAVWMVVWGIVRARCVHWGQAACTDGRTAQVPSTRTQIHPDPSTDLARPSLWLLVGAAACLWLVCPSSYAPLPSLCPQQAPRLRLMMVTTPQLPGPDLFWMDGSTIDRSIECGGVAVSDPQGAHTHRHASHRRAARRIPSHRQIARFGRARRWSDPAAALDRKWARGKGSCAKCLFDRTKWTRSTQKWIEERPGIMHHHQSAE